MTGITKNDIDALRKSLHIGDKVTVDTYNKAEMIDSQSRFPRSRRRLLINGIYPHLVTVYDERSGLTYSKTYVDMLTPGAGRKGGIADGN